MGYEQRDNSGALFKNKKKQPGDKQPDYKGNGMVNGKLVEFAAWIKKAGSGMTYMSLSFSEPRAQQDAGGMGEYQQGAHDASRQSVQARPDARPAPKHEGEYTGEPAHNMADEDLPF